MEREATMYYVPEIQLPDAPRWPYEDATRFAGLLRRSEDSAARRQRIMGKLLQCLRLTW